MYASCVCPKCGNIFDLCAYARQEDFKGTPLEAQALGLTPSQYESWYSRMWETGKFGWFMLPNGDETLAYGGTRTDEDERYVNDPEFVILDEMQKWEQDGQKCPECGEPDVDWV